MSKPGSKEQEALQFLDSLDSLPAATSSSTPAGTPPAADAAEALAFLDEITQKSLEPPARSTTPSGSTRTRIPLGRPGTPSLRSGAQVASARKSVESQKKAEATTSQQGHPPAQEQATQSQSGGGWGWSSVWSGASTVLQQAKQVVDEQVKALPSNDQTRKWGEGMRDGMIGYVKQAQLDKLGETVKAAGLATFTDIMNVVAPPIAEHEVIRVWLSHDMQGYEGVEDLVYRSLARVMEQVEGGDLVVNKGNESRPKDPGSERHRDLNLIEGFDAALKLAQANVDELIKLQEAKAAPEASSTASATQNPTTYSAVFMRIQPFTSSPFPAPKVQEGQEEQEPVEQLQFILHLSDPDHGLTHTSVTQAVPAKWVDIWDEPTCEWVEDLVVEVLRVGVQIIGQEYLTKRMGWGSPAVETEAYEEPNAPAEEHE